MFEKNENTNNTDKPFLQGDTQNTSPGVQDTSSQKTNLVENKPKSEEDSSSIFDIPDQNNKNKTNQPKIDAGTNTLGSTTPEESQTKKTFSNTNPVNETLSNQKKSDEQVEESGFNLQKLQQVKNPQASNSVNFVAENEGTKPICKKKTSCVFTILYLLIGLGLLVIAGLISYDRYVSLLLSPEINAKERQYTINYNNNFQKIKDYIKPAQTAMSQLDLSNTGSYDEVASFISNEQYSFIEKKDKINQAISSYSTSIKTAQSSLESAKQSISKYGYIPVEVDNILGDDKKITTIENSLLSLETIKFASAINVFSYLDTFLNSLARKLSLSKDEVQQEMKNIVKDGEKHINLYIKKCYLNPFEYDYSCNVIGDFDRYYSIVKEEKTFDTKLFKQLLYYLDLKLEFTDIPSFNIMFQKFDANDEEITLSIDINTFKQDELELAKKGIINPHVFILTSLVNSLKQSKFIVGKNLKVDNLNVSESVFKVGLTEFVVKNSQKKYTLPIQKYTEREIFDFIN